MRWLFLPFWLMFGVIFPPSPFHAFITLSVAWAMPGTTEIFQNTLQKIFGSLVRKEPCLCKPPAAEQPCNCGGKAEIRAGWDGGCCLLGGWKSCAMLLLCAELPVGRREAEEQGQHFGFL